jgi:hypothetical protein
MKWVCPRLADDSILRSESPSGKMVLNERRSFIDRPGSPGPNRFSREHPAGETHDHNAVTGGERTFRDAPLLGVEVLPLVAIVGIRESECTPDATLSGGERHSIIIEPVVTSGKRTYPLASH